MSKHARSNKQEAQATSPSRENKTAPPRSSGPPEPSPFPGTARPTEEGPSPTHHQIAVRAYQLWETKGRPDGTDREDWFEAERQLQAAVQ